ncbi:AUGMIN subunit 3 [Camellia lanceoleosa]|uniref:AUGMIN subunit 3 n=1 Tax=Camellia lanceoleosa TaxID=1840588 RepID=A0ACC0IXF3_9ERIC|nr:AUGMIN subunit 3 [Camellia lanceoleosa]
MKPRSKPGSAKSAAKRTATSENNNNQESKRVNKKAVDSDVVVQEESVKKTSDDTKKQLFQRLWSEKDEIVILKEQKEHSFVLGLEYTVVDLVFKNLAQYLIYGVVFAKVIYSRIQKDIYISDSRQRIVSGHLMLAMNLPSMDATLTYKAEASELQRQLRQLQTQYDMLSGQASPLIQGRRHELRQHLMCLRIPI